MCDGVLDPIGNTPVAAKTIAQDANYDDLTKATEALETCISNFFLDNLIAEEPPGTSSISGISNVPAQLMDAGVK